jgi:hypothetical protein
MHIVLIIAAAMGLVALGFIFRSFITKEVGATKAELASWRQRLDSAATADMTVLKREAQTIAGEIRAKL